MSVWIVHSRAGRAPTATQIAGARRAARAAGRAVVDDETWERALAAFAATPLALDVLKDPRAEIARGSVRVVGVEVERRRALAAGALTLIGIHEAQSETVEVRFVARDGAERGDEDGEHAAIVVRFRFALWSEDPAADESADGIVLTRFSHGPVR